ncbi:MAG: tRNA (guanosine(37)-N1)-methyltransferase TrmD [Candidatus Krumholzibacteriota bacterium]|nr:tRNA (guanosine(37)-N1)-methyltransferase TrmD [Candidatus Krumholzibacteriota bacterium]
MALDIHFVTIFPDLFRGPFETGILGIASRKGLARFRTVNVRDFAVDDHGTVDDYAYGGGPGMIMMAPPIVQAVRSVCSPGEEGTRVVHMTPAGELFDQAAAERLAEFRRIVFVCGRYKDIDARVDELVVDERISIGDYIVSGGEFPALVVADAVVRYLRGAVGDERSRDTDSFSGKRGFSLDAAHYTRPPEFEGLRVPDVLISGDHAKIEEWRRRSARERTKRRRPDLLGKGTADGPPVDG